MTTALHYEYLESPIGIVEICASDKAIESIYFVDVKHNPSAPNALTKLAAEQLAAYFDGTLTQFSLPISAIGTTFQQNVWQALTQIPYGETCSYADIATRLQNPKAVRAVGAANGKNPISIVVPCHRVIGASGKLTGYAGGLHRKSWLLALEQRREKHNQ
jgi:methylated-DNA-[protein]-cysteine S-methyltransferase